MISNSFFKNPHKRIHFELVSHLRHLKNFLTVCLSVRGFTRYAIRETFALDTLKRNCRTFPVRHLAGVPFEIPFREIARQMSFTKLADAAALPPQCGGNSVRFGAILTVAQAAGKMKVSKRTVERAKAVGKEEHSGGCVRRMRGAPSSDDGVVFMTEPLPSMAGILMGEAGLSITANSRLPTSSAIAPRNKASCP